MELKDAILSRRSIRRYQQKSVDDDTLTELLEAARMAPTGGNTQKLRFLVIRTPELVEKVFAQTAWGGAVKPRRQPQWEKDAPPAFIAILNNSDSQYEAAGAAVQNMMLRALDFDLGTCWIGAFKRDETKAILNLPEDQIVLFLLAVGYPDESPIAEDATEDDSIKYYLDEQDVLHVPKLTVKDLASWC